RRAFESWQSLRPGQALRTLGACHPGIAFSALRSDGSDRARVALHPLRSRWSDLIQRNQSVILLARRRQGGPCHDVVEVAFGIETSEKCERVRRESAEACSRARECRKDRGHSATPTTRCRQPAHCVFAHDLLLWYVSAEWIEWS